MAQRITNREIPGSVRSRSDFIANSASANTNPPYIATGYLPSEWRDEIFRHQTGIGIDYVVYSYGTPIAWVLATGDTVVPAVKYSSTTSRHQGLVRQGVRNPITSLEDSRKLGSA